MKNARKRINLRNVKKYEIFKKKSISGIISRTRFIKKKTKLQGILSALFLI